MRGRWCRTLKPSGGPAVAFLPWLARMHLREDRRVNSWLCLAMSGSLVQSDCLGDRQVLALWEDAGVVPLPRAPRHAVREGVAVAVLCVAPARSRAGAEHPRAALVAPFERVAAWTNGKLFVDQFGRR